MVVFIVVCTIFLSSTARAYNILVLYPTPSYSHQVPILALSEELIKKGHNLTVISTNKLPGYEKNYTYVDVSSAYQDLFPDDPTEVPDYPLPIPKWTLIGEMNRVTQIVVKEYLSEQFQNFLQRVKDEKLVFDVVIIESYLLHFLVPMANMLAGPKPIVGFISLSTSLFLESQLGSIEHLSYMPFVYNSYSDSMSLFEKIENWYSYHYMVSKMTQNQKMNARNFFKSHGPEFEPLIDDAASKISISMISSNHIYYYPRLLAPNIIEVGPLHLRQPEPLPPSIQAWCDGAEKGVIYMSLGSNMKSTYLPEKMRTNFLKVFKKLPAGYRVLWKWEADGKIPGQSDNIMVQKWFSQQSVLEHPKVSIFITQGGLQSFQEAVHYAVPLLGIPLNGDQELNVKKMVISGIGILLMPQDLYSFEKIEAAVHYLLSNKSYGENMRKKSAISRDFAARSVYTAIFWIEHVVKHGGGEHLKPTLANTTYFEFFCLDILSFILVTCVIVFYFVYRVLRYLISAIFCINKLKIKIS